MICDVFCCLLLRMKKRRMKRRTRSMWGSVVYIAKREAAQPLVPSECVTSKSALRQSPTKIYPLFGDGNDKGIIKLYFSGIFLP